MMLSTSISTPWETVLRSRSTPSAVSPAGSTGRV